MAELMVISIDNSLQAQNQDYFPSRLIIQKDISSAILTKLTSGNNVNKVGVIPLYQEVTNYIVTPTSNTAKLLNFVNSCDLSPCNAERVAMFQMGEIFSHSEIQSKRGLIFLSTMVQDQAEFICEISRHVDSGVALLVVCFADALSFSSMLEDSIDSPNFNVLAITPDSDVEKVLRAYLSKLGEDDDALNRVLEQSVYDQ